MLNGVDAEVGCPDVPQDGLFITPAPESDGSQQLPTASSGLALV